MHRPNAWGPARILPDGCIDVIWASDGELFVEGPGYPGDVYQGRSATSLTGIRLPPGLGPLVLGVPAHGLRDRRVSLDSILRPAEVRAIGNAAGSMDAAPVLRGGWHRGRGQGGGSERASWGRSRTHPPIRAGAAGRSRFTACATAATAQPWSRSRATIIRRSVSDDQPSRRRPPAKTDTFAVRCRTEAARPRAEPLAVGIPPRLDTAHSA